MDSTNDNAICMQSNRYLVTIYMFQQYQYIESRKYHSSLILYSIFSLFVIPKDISLIKGMSCSHRETNYLFMWQNNDINGDDVIMSY